MTSATDKAAAIEGFGTAVQPFERMLGDFQAKFHVEPDISVRLIEPSQCEVTNFLRFLGQTAADKPQLVLDRTSVPNGTPISGTLVTRGGLISSVLLIDHKGMVFNLDDRIVVQSGQGYLQHPDWSRRRRPGRRKGRAADHNGDHRPPGYSGGCVLHADASLGAAPQNSRGNRDRRISVLSHRQVFPARRIAWAPDGTPPLVFAPLVRRPADKAA